MKFIYFFMLFFCFYLNKNAFADNKSDMVGRCEYGVFSSSPSGSLSDEMSSEIHFTCSDVEARFIPGRSQIAISLVGSDNNIPTVWVYDWRKRKEDWALKYNRQNHVKETQDTFAIEYPVSAVVDHIGERLIPVEAHGVFVKKIIKKENKITFTLSANYYGLDKNYHSIYYVYSINNIPKEKIIKALENSKDNE